jgi:hypothetical protein
MKLKYPVKLKRSIYLELNFKMLTLKMLWVYGVYYIHNYQFVARADIGERAELVSYVFKESVNELGL